VTAPQEITLPPMFDDLDVGIIVHDPQTGAILAVNESSTEIYGYSGSELRQMSVEDYTAPSTTFSQDRAVERIRAAADGEPQEFEWQIQRSDGNLRWVRVNLNLSTLRGTQCVIAEISEITEYRKRDRRLRLLSRIVRHNLRNKMTVVKGRAAQLKTALEDDAPEGSIEAIIDTAMEVGGLSESVRQIEEIAEPNATERSPTSLPQAARAAIKEASADHPAADITLDIQSDTTVVADRGIGYALDHAIENAIVHNDQDVPAVTVTVSTDSVANEGIIQVADNGPSIPDVEVDVLNEEIETSSTYHGTGVGLWVMHWCVTSLGGELTFADNTPRGNRVSMRLPRPEQN